MVELGYYQAPVDTHEFDDGWMRTFGEVPEFSKEELEMLHSWRDKGKYGNIMIYLTGDKYCDMSQDFGEFVLREIIRGNI